MDYKKLSLGLGFFSLALGVTELLGAKSIAKALDADDHTGIVKGFGIRELAAGFAILAQPAVATGIWGRVAGDAMDIGLLAAAVPNSRKPGALTASTLMVLGITALDVLCAVRVQRKLNQPKMSEKRPSIEPEVHAVEAAK